MQRIDAHVHFWDYDPVRNSWITDEMAVLKKDFLPADIQPLLEENSMDGCVLVQVNQSETENNFFLKLASENQFIKAIVGWVDLSAANISERLSSYKDSYRISGFRHILQDEKDRAFMLRPDFERGIRALAEFDFTYDLLIYPDQLPYAAGLIKSFPQQPFIIDHLAKPAIRDMEMAFWKEQLYNISRMDNVYCKLSGMVTEARWNNWTKEDFRPYLDVVVESFGIDRIVFGSDWPVCLAAASYEEVVGIMEDYFSSFSILEQEKIFGSNAMTFYGL
jgi:L-fuconolactonase